MQQAETVDLRNLSVRQLQALLRWGTKEIEKQKAEVREVRDDNAAPCLPPGFVCNDWDGLS